MLKQKNEEKPKMFIGYYSKSVILTYIGVISGVIGMYFAFNSKITYALICLIISGLCDAFDGKVARKCKRTRNEVSFGIQLDSLADMVSFIFLPITIFYGLGYDSWYNVLIYIMFTLGGVIRLAYFNVIADEKKEGPVTYYCGLPVTASAVVYPVVYLCQNFTSPAEFKIIFSLTMLFIAILYVLNFKLKKPGKKVLYFFLIGGTLLASALYFLN